MEWKAADVNVFFCFSCVPLFVRSFILVLVFSIFWFACFFVCLFVSFFACLIVCLWLVVFVVFACISRMNGACNSLELEQILRVADKWWAVPWQRDTISCLYLWTSFLRCYASTKYYVVMILFCVWAHLPWVRHLIQRIIMLFPNVSSVPTLLNITRFPFPR